MMGVTRRFRSLAVAMAIMAGSVAAAGPVSGYSADNACGTFWDPVGIDGDAGSVSSVRIRDPKSGTVIACTNKPSVPLEATVGHTKIRAGGIRGLALIDDGGSRRLILSISGPTGNARYKLIGRQDDCSTVGPRSFTLGFQASGTGTALRDMEIDLGTAG